MILFLLGLWENVINKLNIILIIDFLVIWGNMSIFFEMNILCVKILFYFNVYEL